VEALHSRRNSPAAVSGLGKGKEQQKVSKEWRIGAGSGRNSPQPATPTTNPLVAALPVVEPRTPVIVVEEERPYAVAGTTPLPPTSHNPTPLLPQMCLQLQPNPQGMLDGVDFRGQRCSRLRLIVPLVVGSREMAVTLLGHIGFHACEAKVKVFNDQQRRVFQSSHASKLKKIRCSYCDAKTPTSLDDCWDFNKIFPQDKPLPTNLPSSPGNSGP
jgi:hypothetical protein